jgi:hypothetical protein
MNRPTLAELKQRFSLAQTAAALGITPWPDAPGLIASPLRGDKKPSLSIYRGRDGHLRWKDHATGDGGDQIDLIQVHRSCTQKDAIEIFTKLTNTQ